MTIMDLIGLIKEVFTELGNDNVFDGAINMTDGTTTDEYHEAVRHEKENLLKEISKMKKKDLQEHLTELVNAFMIMYESATIADGNAAEEGVALSWDEFSERAKRTCERLEATT